MSNLVQSTEGDVHTERVGQILIFDAVHDLGQVSGHQYIAQCIRRGRKTSTELEEGFLDAIDGLLGVQIILNQRNRKFTESAKLAVKQVTFYNRESSLEAVATEVERKDVAREEGALRESRAGLVAALARVVRLLQGLSKL